MNHGFSISTADTEARIELKPIHCENSISLYRLTLDYPNLRQPTPVRISWEEDMLNLLHVWHPTNCGNRFMHQWFAPSQNRSFFCEGAPYAGTLPADVFKLTVKGEGAAAVTLKNKEGQTLTFGVDKDNKVFFDRTKAGAKDFNLSFASKVFGFMAADRFYDGAWTIELTMDVSACEMFIDNGTRAFSNVLFPDSPYTELTVDGAASVTVHGYKG